MTDWNSIKQSDDPTHAAFEAISSLISFREIRQVIRDMHADPEVARIVKRVSAMLMGYRQREAAFWAMQAQIASGPAPTQGDLAVWRKMRRARPLLF